MTKRIIISGCSGGGKSTLIRALAIGGFHTVVEAGRCVVENECRLESEAFPWVNMPLFLERAISLAVKGFDYSPSNMLPVFYDRSLVDLILAFKLVTASSKYDNLLKEKRYFETVFLVPPWEDIYVTDQVRRHSFEDAVDEYERLKTGYPKLGYKIEIIPKSDVETRIEYILNGTKTAKIIARI